MVEVRTEDVPMVSVLLSALGATGAAEHLVGVAEALLRRGNSVSVVSTSRGLESFRRLDVDLHPVPEAGHAASDALRLPTALPPVLKRARNLYARVQGTIIDPLPEQAAVVRRVLRSTKVDVIVSDALFLGGSMVSALPRSARPAVIMLGIFAPWIPDPGVPPYGLGFSPADNQTNRLRSAIFELLAAGAYRRLSRSFNAKVQEAFGTRRRGDLRAAPARADVWAQLTVPRFEYPRSALPANFRFVGPLHPVMASTHPDWWDPSREPPVVVVRSDGDTGIRDLVLPTIEAFRAVENIVVLIVGPSRSAVDAASNIPLPPSVHFETLTPWSRLIPQRTTVLSNGDYVYCQHALRYGIPVIVAGTLETDVETAARLVWCGAGVDLKTRRPSPEIIASEVQRIRSDPSFGIAAAKIAAQIQTTHAETEICNLVEEMTTVMP